MNLTPQENQERWNAEKAMLEFYFSERDSSLEVLGGAERLYSTIECLATMGHMMEVAREHAMVGNLDESGHVLGTFAKRMKDGIYMELMDSAGLTVEDLLREGIPENLEIMRDYIKNRYEVGEEACAQILEGGLN